MPTLAHDVAVTDPFWTVTATTATTTSGEVWAAWATSGTASTTFVNCTFGADGFTPQAISRRDDLIARNRRRAADLRRKRAERTAEALLRSQLTAEQRAEYDRLQRFHVVVGDRTYRIRRGWAGNIDLIEDGAAVERWCVHPRQSVPVPDNLLAQKLMLECGQADELRRIANVTPLRRAA